MALIYPQIHVIQITPWIEKQLKISDLLRFLPHASYSPQQAVFANHPSKTVILQAFFNTAFPYYYFFHFMVPGAGTTLHVPLNAGMGFVKENVIHCMQNSILDRNSALEKYFPFLTRTARDDAERKSQ